MCVFVPRMMTATLQDVAIEEQNLWLPARRVQNDLFEMIDQLLRISPAIRAQVIEWVGYALDVSSSLSRVNHMRSPMDMAKKHFINALLITRRLHV